MCEEGELIYMKININMGIMILKKCQEMFESVG